MYIPNGAIILARTIQYSDIWLNKPAWWLKVWCYILIQVNHQDNKEFQRGTGFFNMEHLFYACKLKKEHIKSRSLDNVVRWLREQQMITTRLTTRGIIISVCNYKTYQKLDNYKNDDKNDNFNDDRTTIERRSNDTINKKGRKEERKNVKRKEPKTILSCSDEIEIIFKDFWKLYPRKIEKSTSLTRFKNKIKKKDFKNITIAVKNYSIYVSGRDKKYIKHCTTWLSNWEDWLTPSEEMLEEAIVNNNRLTQTQVSNLRNLEKFKEEKQNAN